jgi:hypothetical protein
MSVDECRDGRGVVVTKRASERLASESIGDGVGFAGTLESFAVLHGYMQSRVLDATRLSMNRSISSAA